MAIHQDEIERGPLSQLDGAFPTFRKLVAGPRTTKELRRDERVDRAVLHHEHAPSSKRAHPVVFRDDDRADAGKTVGSSPFARRTSERHLDPKGRPATEFTRDTDSSAHALDEVATD